MTASSGRLWLGVAGCASAAVSSLIWRRRDRLPGLRDRERWDRVNYRGRHVDLVAGPAFALGAAAGLLAAPGITAAHRAAGLTALLGSATFGLIDDLADRSHAKGLAGHVRALAGGRLTTGGVKVVGIGASSLLAALLSRDGGARPNAGAALVAGGIIAASANLVNLLDLRPGRALKVGILGAMLWGLRAADSPGSSGSAQVCAGGVIGPSLVLWRADLDEEAMLGDCGANALGALLGVLLLLRTSHRPSAVRTRILFGMACATVISEKVSFTAVIEATPVLRHIDAWGRGTSPTARTPTATAAFWAGRTTS